KEKATENDHVHAHAKKNTHITLHAMSSLRNRLHFSPLFFSLSLSFLCLFFSLS
ncbi:hypothetical protein CSUI_004084, partial [Cystoisospora suis]